MPIPGQTAFDELEPANEPGDTAAALHAFVGDAEAQEPPDAHYRPNLSQPYALVALAMWEAGWKGVLPLPRGEKASPPTVYDPRTGKKVHGWTGGDGKGGVAPYPSYPDVMAWTETDGGGNVALRMQAGEVYDTLAIDVDDYGDKPGAATLAELEAELGPLPATWRITARGAAGRGGKWIFRVPAGLYCRGGFPGIEILQVGHRYAVAPPSTNRNAGHAHETWYTPQGQAVGPLRFPHIGDLAILPEAWVEALRRTGGRSGKLELGNEATQAWLDACTPGIPCGRMKSIYQRYARELRARGSRSRHDIIVAATSALVALGGEGHGGAQEACNALRDVFVAEVTREGTGGLVRATKDAEAEFGRAVNGAVALAARKNRLPRIGDDECVVWDVETGEPHAPEWTGATRPAVAARRVATPPASPAAASDVPARETAIAPQEGPDVTGGADGEDTAPPALPETPLTANEAREPLNVSNTDISAQWLRDNIGRGPLAGMFKRGPSDVIVYTPTIGSAGYIRPANGDDDGPAQVRPFSKEGLAARIQYTYRCFKEREATTEAEKKKGTTLPDGRVVIRTPGMFPLDAARTALHAADMLPHLRRLAGVVHTPTVRKDGSILALPGYDDASKFLHLPEPGLNVPAVPANPTPAELGAARKLILKMVGDFPFVTTHDRAAYLGLLLTPLMRDITPAPYKLFTISAHQAGSGKTLLAKLVKAIHGGVFKSEMPEDAAELRKQITGILETTTGPTVTFDNVTGVVRSSTLAGLVTSADWDDRKLGANDLARCVNDRVWVLTGNNMTLGGDMVRRTIWVNIDPGMPNPHLRQGFDIPDVEAWTRRNRGDILHALLTMITAWVARGRPSRAASSDGYEGWLGAINGILGVAEIPGTCDEAEARGQSEGEDDSEWAGMLAAIQRVFGDAAWTAKEVLMKVHTSHGLPGIDGLLEKERPIALDELPSEFAEKLIKLRAEPTILTKSLGRWLSNRKGRWAGGLTVREVPGSGKHASRWRIESF